MGWCFLHLEWIFPLQLNLTTPSQALRSMFTITIVILANYLLIAHKVSHALYLVRTEGCWGNLAARSALMC